MSFKAYAGLRTLDSPKKEALCGVLGPDSNSVIICQKELDAPVVTPIPRLEGMHPGGIDISWEIPEEQADITIAVSTGKLLWYLCYLSFDPHLHLASTPLHSTPVTHVCGHHHHHPLHHHQHHPPSRNYKACFLEGLLGYKIHRKLRLMLQ